MAKEIVRIPDFDDIVFEKRNKEYGAYKLRKKYHRTAIVALLIGIIILCAAVVTPYFKATTIQAKAQKEEREVIAVMENLDQPEELTVAPPPPPPPAETQQQVKYVAPEVVDTINPGEEIQLLTADESIEIIQDEEVVEIVENLQEEEVVEEYEPPEEVFLIVEEMPEFPGGTEALFKYIYDHIEYPQVALDNEIEGNVYVKFCVTYQGKVDQISIIRGVHPSLDAEAIRLIGTLPTWKPGKQSGNPVNVWYQFRIQFQLIRNI